MTTTESQNEEGFDVGEAERKEEVGGDEENVKDVENTPAEATKKIIKKIGSAVKKGLSYRQEDDEQEVESPVPEDIFSLMYICEAGSWAFFYSIICYSVQMMIIILILYDLIDSDSKTNRIKMPTGVDLAVTIAQGIAMILAACTQTNFLAGLSRMALEPSYDHEYVTSIYPNATQATYRLSFILQLVAGLTMLLDSFILNMQSTTVLSLMLNFAALSFISEIQQIAFWIAKNGFISIVIQEAAHQVVNFQIPKQHRMQSNYTIKRICFVAVLIILMALYGYLAHMQRSGAFICNKLVVQFGDDFRQDLTFFSGTFIRTGELISSRAVYEEERSANLNGAYQGPIAASRFAYCAEEKAWTFSGPYDLTNSQIIDGNLTLPELNEDPCKYWVKSRKTTAYDITETLSQPWLVNDYYTNQTMPLSFLYLECNDCEGGRATQSCSGHGDCVSNTCECNDGRVGINCEFPRPCPKLELDLRTEPFPYAAGGLFVPATSYDLLLDNQSNPVTVYSKPVYVAYLTKSSTIPLNVLVFTGRRYALLLNLDFKDATEWEQLREGLPDYLPIEFHSWFSDHRVYFFSEPMDVGSSSDWSSPKNLQWFRAQALIQVKGKGLYGVDENQPTNTVLLCPVCTVVWNDCKNGGQCNIDSRINGNLHDLLNQSGDCTCPHGFAGHLCEKELDCFASNATCLHGGNCTADGSCSCSSRYTGKLCQYELDEAFIDAFLPGR